MTRQHKSSIFVKYTRGSLEYIQILGLSWCKCMSYKTGKLGGWVSENYLAHARLITWFYGSIDEVAVNQESIVPNIPQKNWTRQQNHAWLSICGLNSKGNATELKIGFKATCLWKVDNHLWHPLRVGQYEMCNKCCSA